MSDQPVSAATTPARVDLEEGKTYFWCQCGRSESQPFCDGSHKGSGINPVRFSAEKSGPVWLCQCKKTENSPFCDGSHKAIPQA